MRNRAHRLLSVALLLSVCAPAAFAAEPADVLVHGAGRTTGPNPLNPVWIANIVSDPKDPSGPGTQILYREKIGDDQWQEFSRIAFKVVEITSESSELVVLKDNRISWAWFSTSGSGTRFSYGPELPDHQKILALAGDRKGLWAIGLPTSRSTQPATQSAANPTTIPTTRPAGPLLHKLATDGWTALEAPWPAGVSFNDADQVSMAVVNEIPTLAINTGDRFIQLVQYSKSTRRWEKKDRIDNESKTPVQWFKMLSLADQPAVWYWADVEGSLGEIWTPNRVIKLPAIAGIGLGDADVTVAGDTIWLVYRTNQRKLFQQRFNLDGSRADDKPTEVNYLKAGDSSARGDWMTIGAMTMLTLLILIALLRRRAAAKGEDDSESEE
ncbi:MAG TPA: hypothetical protein VGP99_00125 [Tepidisphaeraceae bacterium]|nr:hypothetical protein [Tepidisphaeraceae bacterium]